jgi:hypothetical protein
MKISALISSGPRRTLTTVSWLLLVFVEPLEERRAA